VHDLSDVGVDLTPERDGDYTTVAGLVIAHLGHLPASRGECVTVDGWRIEVTAVERRTVTGVRLVPSGPPST
jgi:putative hemolysin